VEAYHQKLQDYQRLFLTATQQEYPLSEATRNDLRQQQQHLGLTDVDVAPMEAQITTQIESYHQKLQQYEQAFVKATQFEYPLSDVTRKELQHFQRILELDDAEIAAIEAIIIQSSSEAEKQQKLQQYIQQPSRTQATQPLQERITRQKFLKWAGLGGVGLVTAVVGREIFKGQS
ncbi:MAG: hypothetical protein ACYTX0_47795, partial [Nostoc sp.]